MLALFPEIIHAADQKNLETLACLVRKYFAEEQVHTPRLQVEPLMLRAGLQLSKDDLKEHAVMRALDHKGAWHVSVTLNTKLPAHEINFALAHLFGHFFCDLQLQMARSEINVREFVETQPPLSRLISGPSSTGPELLADHFAMALLMPQGMVIKAYEVLGNVENAASFFRVPAELMRLRLRQLGQLKQASPAHSTGITSKVLPSKASPKKEPVSKASATTAGAVNSAATPSSSLMRAQKSAAAMSYRRENESQPERNQPSDPESATKQVLGKSSKGMGRLRELARKIDKTVEP